MAVTGANLRKGNSRSCGCSRRENIEVELAPGMQIGHLTLIELSAEPIGGMRRWLVECDCTKTKYVRPGDLRSGRTQSCGHAKPGRAPSVFPGNRYGRLRVIAEEPHRGPHNKRVFECLCDCKTTVHNVLGNLLQSGHTRSCGCLHADSAKEMGVRNRVHGHASEGERSPTYKSWSSIFGRCLNPNHKDYPNYGGRGITICDRWNNRVGGSYANFLAEMGDRPTERYPSGYLKYSLDRIDVNGNYEHSNCRWADATQQANNRRQRIQVDAVAEIAYSMLDTDQADSLLDAITSLSVNND